MFSPTLLDGKTALVTASTSCIGLKTAEIIASYMKSHQGLITRDDLACYRAIERPPVNSHDSTEIAVFETWYNPVETLGQGRLSGTGRAHHSDRLTGS